MDNKSAEEDVRQRLQDIFEREGKVTERELLRISAMTGVDYFTVSKTLEEIVLHRGKAQDSPGA
jgi:NAD kinase